MGKNPNIPPKKSKNEKPGKTKKQKQKKDDLPACINLQNKLNNDLARVNEFQSRS